MPRPVSAKRRPGQPPPKPRHWSVSILLLFWAAICGLFQFVVWIIGVAVAITLYGCYVLAAVIVGCCKAGQRSASS